MTRILHLCLSLFINGFSCGQFLGFGQAPPNWQGNWQGTLQSGPAKLRIGLHITRTPAGVYTSTLDSIDQGATGLPVAATRISGRLIHLDLPNLRASYDGELSADGNAIEGEFTQGTD